MANYPIGEAHKLMLAQGEKIFADRRNLERFWEASAENFYPDLCGFSVADPPMTEEYAGNLTSSYPIIARRTLGDSLSALLRPTTLDTTSPGVWFSMRTDDDRDADLAGRKWLENATKIMRRVMYDRRSQFTRSMKEADHQFVTFGNAPISISPNKANNGLLYQTWHLKDVAWTEDSEGEINTVWRRWSPTALQLRDAMSGKIHDQVANTITRDPFMRVRCMHIMVKAETYEQRDLNGKRFNQPWISIWIDIDNQHLMEERGSLGRHYIIPRWVTVPGSQYAVSPAVTAALPDARLFQAMTQTILEAGEKFANPPMTATKDAIRSDVSLFAGGLTWVDYEYDERAGAAVKPVFQPTAGQGLNGAMELSQKTMEMIAKAFFLDSLSLPPAEVREMTAFETAQRMSEWIRRAMPIFEPMEFDFNGQVCEETFILSMAMGTFGSMYDIPPSIRGANVQYKFESPLHQSADRQLGQKFLECKAVLVQAAEIDPNSVPVLDATQALRDSLKGIGAPATWVRDEDTVAGINKQKADAQAQEQQLATGQAGADVAAKLGAAAKDFSASQQQAA